MYAGIDIGTSGVKTVLVDEDRRLVASATARLTVSRPHDGWSEQHPDDWWQAVLATLDQLAAEHGHALAALKGIGLSGQMLGVVLVDRADRPLRPAILWNDGRAVSECAILRARLPDIGKRGCTDPDPGFGAPKLLWLARHEPEVIDRTDCLLLPKDYVRLRFTGERGSEPSDASGTLLFDNDALDFAADMADAAGFPTENLPPLGRAWQAMGMLRPELARRWGIAGPVVVAGGAGDNLACKLGVGAARPGRGVLTLGTSGVLCVTTRDFRPIPGRGVQTPPHAAPGQYSSQGVVMSAASAVEWLAALTGVAAQELDAEAAALWDDPDGRKKAAAAPAFLAYLDGVRTPHADAGLRAVADGLSLSTTRPMMAWSIFEGVALHLAEVAETQRAHGIAPESLQLVGGGARSAIWPRMIASLLGLPLTLSRGRDNAAATGAARLAMTAVQGGDPLAILQVEPERESIVEPDDALSAFLNERMARQSALRAHAMKGR
ncbi:MAG TPA: xylulokinase [Rhizobiaceae bacterium]|nr:xylulokinase [Rhizobiaceae bacterium]